jgi:hypothetical protein
VRERICGAPVKAPIQASEHVGSRLARSRSGEMQIGRWGGTFGGEIQCDGARVMAWLALVIGPKRRRIDRWSRLAGDRFRRWNKLADDFYLHFRRACQGHFRAGQRHSSQQGREICRCRLSSSSDEIG